MKNKSYSDLLKDSRWIEKREEILQRDNYRCVPCSKKADDLPATGKQLHIHHLIYKRDLNLWEYDDKDLITLCDECHKFITSKIINCNEIIRRLCIDDDISDQLEYLLMAVSKMDNPWRLRDIAKKLLYLE